jgi:hypothetical protein
MYRITTHHDDRHHPLDGDIRTVGSLGTLLAIALATFEDTMPAELADLLPGERCQAYGFGVDYTVERIA